MRSISRGAALLVALAASLAAFPPSALAVPAAPAWKLDVSAQPTYFIPSSKIEQDLLVVASNVGGQPTEGDYQVSLTLPAPLTVALEVSTTGCSTIAQVTTCTNGEVIDSGQNRKLGDAKGVFSIGVPPLPEGTTLSAEVEVSGGGAPTVTASIPIKISSAEPLFDLFPGENGFNAPWAEADGSAATAAGSHPYSATTDLRFPTIKPGGSLTSSGHLRDAVVELPSGFLGNPSATPARCTEAELTSDDPGCPLGSQVGTATVASFALGIDVATTPLYNMVPPPGAPAAFSFNALGAGIFPHILASIRSDGDYGADAASTDILAKGLNPILGVSVQLWGDPASTSHDYVRGECLSSNLRDACPLESQDMVDTAFLSLPTHCTGQPSLTTAHADSWEEPESVKTAGYQSASLSGTPYSLSGCGALDFVPTLTAQPTTNRIDSPSGLDVDLHQPQNTDKAQKATSALRDATATLPPGLVVNPSQAGGLQACSSSQIGLSTGVGESPIHFSKQSDTCPLAAKIGSLEVTTPLLAEYDAQQHLATDPETGKPIPDPLQGSVYLAKPFDNPFKSLLAIYLSIDDPQTGTVAKLAGKVITDPATGQLTTRFTENPQLPLEDVRIHLFEGARASLITPPNCATHTTTSDLIPWSAPEGADAHPSDSFQTTAAPGGGACSTSPEQAPNAPTFTAGTVAPQAGAYSPFVLKLSREDGSQRLTGFDTLLPPGLSGKIAGIPACSDAALAQAASRSNPEEGILERNTPSCPASSALGTVNVAAGAGPTPIWTQGTAYLAGPYKSAPLSMAVITPAIAGPFDLGVVVVRAALYLNPDSAQIHAVSDPFPTILHGVPLDLRSVAVSLDRSSFTLNPTSCDPMSITGTATSTFGQAAPLTSPFQVGGCPELPFKPKLSLQLKGKTKRTSHPTLIANLTAKPGEANIARAQVKLPGAAFLDQAHIGTVCTRVQFAAHNCPAGSIYGKVSATTPLLDYTLTGNVYLRSSSHELPDLIADLNGPATQPIEIALAGTTDAVKGALRNTFEAVPDAPVSKFHLELFGGKRGLIILSSGLCKSPKATAKLDGQNGKAFDTRPTVRTSCPKKSSKHGKHGSKK